MAFFKFRKGGDDQATTAPPPESVEAMRKRAKHRLIGAAVLVLIGVIGFPLLVDKQPRPIAVDIPIEIPDKNKVKPLVAQAPAVQPAPVPAAPAVVPSATAVGRVGDVAPPKAAPALEPKADKSVQPASVAKSVEKPEAKPEPKAADKVAAKPEADTGTKAQALLDGKEAPKEAPKPPPAAAEDRYVVQVGAFADVTKAREARLKVEHAGLKTYTQVVETKDGRRIRVRVGPFATKAEADKAAEKIKKLDLAAAILTL